MTTNALLEDWSGPHGGVPPFDRVRIEDFEPAFDEAMNDERTAIDAIVRDPAAPTFANTIAKLEDAGRAFARLNAVYGVWTSTMSTPELRAIERRMAPKLAAFDDETVQNSALFARIAAVHAANDPALGPEQKRLVWRTYTSFVRAGAKLDGDAKKRLSAINQRLAVLTTSFGQNVLADEEKAALVVDAEADLDGLPDDLKASAKAAAERRNVPAKWVIENTRSAIEPFLTYAKRRDLREKAFRAFVTRGANGDGHDNAALITEILELRRERANLLGFATHAHWRLENAMAKTPEGALALMNRVWPRAVARAREEIRDMEALAGEPIRPWDYRHYAEMVRKAKYDLDEAEVKPYLGLESMRDAMFWVAERLFGFVFTPADDIAVAHPDVRVYRVSDRETKQHRGLWFFDPYARIGKQSGAWMSSYRKQERFAGNVTPIVSNNANVLRPGGGAPALLGWADAVTMFHEFGHALHALASDVTYPRLSGTSVARDFVELPSQLFEHWLMTPEVLERFARHHATGEPMPKSLVAKIAKAATFNQGFATVEYLSAAIVDMELHLAAERVADPNAFERATLERLGMPEAIVMRHRTPHFAHAFSDEAYAAGYYSYLWADALVADAFEAFTEKSGPYDADVAKRLRTNILAVGDTIDAAEAWRAFRGRDVDVDALLRKRGLAEA